jgi:hypothetical protein
MTGANACRRLSSFCIPFVDVGIVEVTMGLVGLVIALSI